MTVELDPDALPYSIVEQVLLTMHLDVGASRPALLGRFRYLQRLGFPASKVGRGKKVAYGIDEVLQLALAFELLQIGMQPVRAARLVRTDWTRTRSAFGDAIAWPSAAPVIALFPYALDELSAEPDLQDAPAGDPVSILKRKEIADWLDTATGISSVCVIIDPRRVVAGLRSALASAMTDDRRAAIFLGQIVDGAVSA